MDIIQQLQVLNLTQKYLANKFNCRPQQIYSAIHNNDQPTLKKKIIKHLTSVEKRNAKR